MDKGREAMKRRHRGVQEERSPEGSPGEPAKASWSMASKMAGRQNRGKIKAVRTPRRSPRPWKWSPAQDAQGAGPHARGAPVRDKIRNITANLAQANPSTSTRSCAGGSAGRPGVIVVTTDKGLCGGLNTNILRAVTTSCASAQAEGTSDPRRSPSATRAWVPEPHRRAQVVARASPAGRRPQLEKLIGPVKVMLDASSPAKRTRSTCATPSSSTR